jgi:hypothetical protein
MNYKNNKANWILVIEKHREYLTRNNFLINNYIFQYKI